MRAFHLLCAFICCCLALCAPLQAQINPNFPQAIESLPAKDGLKVSISAPQKWNERQLTLQPDNPHINVLLQNTSSKPVTIFEAWNSWGFDNLTLEITKIDGKPLDTPLAITKGRMSFLENYPSAETIRPGEILVREVFLYVPPKVLNPAAQESNISPPGSLYLEFPFPTRGTRRQITLRAVFAVHEESRRVQGGKINVWTGKIASPSLDYQVSWR